MPKKPKSKKRNFLLPLFALALAAAALAGGVYWAAPLEAHIPVSARAFWNQIASALALKPPPARIPQSLSESAAAPDSTANDAIEVYFAPVTPLNPWGIDNRLTALISHAQSSIDAAFYELELTLVADALIERHQQGISVRLVSDSQYESREAMQKCIQAGIPAVFDQRDAFMHNKFCVVDGQRVWTGSTNITENGMYRNNNNAVLFYSESLAADFHAEFSEMFELKKFGKRSPKNTPCPVLTLGKTTVECYFAPEDGVQNEIISEINECRKTIDFMAFSFTSKPIAAAMASRMAKGVKVRGLFEARDMGSPHCQDDYLREHGAQVFPDRNSYNMHHKVIILDTSTVITGSYNFSKNAEAQNDENAVIIHDSAVAGRYAEEFEKLTRN